MFLLTLAVDKYQTTLNDFMSVDSSYSNAKNKMHILGDRRYNGSYCPVVLHCFMKP